MPHGSSKLFVVMAIGLFVCFAAAEKRIKEGDLPAAVKQAAKRETKGAIVRGYSTEVENGQREYEVETLVNGRSRDITFAPDGSILETEEQVNISDLPFPVRDGLKRKAGKDTITKVESLGKQGKIVAYEAKVREGEKHFEIKVGPDGQPLAHPE